MKTSLLILQVLLLIVISPLFSGIIKKIKNTLRMRKGPGILQPYYDLYKLSRKDEVVSGTASWIFRAAPLIALCSSASALFLLPVFNNNVSFNMMGDFFLIVFIFALGRFFIALAGLDTGSAFGGMGSSREMFISALVEPVMIIALFVICINSGSTGLQAAASCKILRFSTLLAACSILIITLAETSRIPIDNQETHLELTMVHEAMVLEYSGRSLAAIELASHIKQLILFSVIIISLPLNVPAFWGIPAYFAELAVISAVIAFVEISMAKMRLFRVPEFISFAFVLSAVALVVSVMGY